MKKFILFLLSSFFIIQCVHAAVQVTYSAFEGSIDQNGQFSSTTIPALNFDHIGFVCNSTNCTSVSRKFTEGQSVGNTVFISYPTQLASLHGYGVYFFKEGYIPWEVAATWSGTGSRNSTLFLTKKEGCFAPLTNLIIVNEAEENIPAIINFSVSIDAKTSAAIRNSGPLFYAPPEIKEHYQVMTRVTLAITNSSGEIVHTEAKDISLDFSNSAFVSFTWVPRKKGNHRINIISEVIDAKCSSSLLQTSSGTLEVLQARPRNLCYSLIKSFSRDKEFPVENESITFSIEKISNYADGNGILAPLKSSVTADFFQEKKLFKTFSFLLQENINANEFSTFHFNENFPEGNYTASLRIISNDSRCSSIPNIETIRTMDYHVLKQLEPIPPQSKLNFEIISPRNISYTTSTIPIQISSDQNASFSYSLNFGERFYFASPSHIEAMQGSNYLEISAENQSKNVTFFVDSIAPSITIISPENKIYSNQTILVHINASDLHLQSVWFTINDGQEELYHGPFLRIFSSGDNFLKAFAMDILGNLAISRVAFSINGTTMNESPRNETPPRRGGGGGGKTKIATCIPQWKCTEWTGCDSTGMQYRICQQERPLCQGVTPSMTRICSLLNENLSLASKDLPVRSEIQKRNFSPWIFLLTFFILIEIAVLVFIVNYSQRKRE